MIADDVVEDGSAYSMETTWYNHRPWIYNDD